MKNRAQLNDDRRKRIKRQLELLDGPWTDAAKLEYLMLDIEPYSGYYRLGMIKTLKKAIKHFQKEERKNK